MQTRFAKALFQRRPAKLFLPIQAAPLFLPQRTEVTVTVHDLAFRFFPETFPFGDRLRLNVLLRRAVGRADKIIAISESTKRDLLAFAPHIPEERIRVIYHGFDRSFFGERLAPEALSALIARYGLVPKEYLLFLGALQPR
jgi:hypothetical protein